MTAPHWTNKYIGLAFDRKTMNCAHLVELVYKTECNRALRLPKIEDFSMKGLNADLQLHFQDYCAEISRPARDFDIVLMRSWKLYNHVGVVAFIDGKINVLHSLLDARQVVLTPWARLAAIHLQPLGVFECR